VCEGAGVEVADDLKLSISNRPIRYLHPRF